MRESSRVSGCGLALALAAVTAVGCTASSGPMSPSPAPASVTTLSGVVSATNGGQPLANVSVTAAREAVVTDAGGAFALHLAGPSSPYAVVISDPSIVTRTTTLALQGPGTASLSVFHQDGSFDLSFYRAFARNGYEQPSQLQPIRRWTHAPQIYLRTIDEAGTAIDAVTLDAAAAALADATPIWSGGLFSSPAISKGTDTREGTSGWITVRWTNASAAGRCGLSQIATDGGWIELNSLGASCSCGGASRIYPRLVRHELGHAFGFYHTDDPNDVMYGQSIPSNACDARPSARERQCATYVYSRPVGNTDPDNDPVSNNSSRSVAAIVQQD